MQDSIYALQLRRRGIGDASCGPVPPESARFGLVGSTPQEPTRGTRYLEPDPDDHVGHRCVNGWMGRSHAFSRHLGPCSRPLHARRRRAPVNQSTRTTGRYPWPSQFLASRQSFVRSARIRFSSHPRRYQELDQPRPSNYGSATNSTETLRRQQNFSRPAVHPQRTQHLGRQTQPTAGCLRLSTHSFSYRLDPGPAEHLLHKPSLRPPGNHHPWNPPFFLSHGNRTPGPSRLAPTSDGGPILLACGHGGHPHYSPAGANRPRSLAPRPSPIRCRGHRPRLAGPALVPASPPCLLYYLSPPRPHLAPSPAHRAYTEASGWTGRLLVFHRRPPDNSPDKATPLA
jgi:hypothetical protein